MSELREWRARIGPTKINAPDEEWARRSLARWDRHGVGCVEFRTVTETPRQQTDH